MMQPGDINEGYHRKHKAPLLVNCSSKDEVRSVGLRNAPLWASAPPKHAITMLLHVLYAGARFSPPIPMTGNLPVARDTIRLLTALWRPIISIYLMAAGTTSPDPALPVTNDNRQRRPPLSAVLPPLLLGTATFNHQYVTDPHSMPYRDIVARAISLGIRAFDTSPYYGPSELLLGDALNTLMNRPSSPSSAAAAAAATTTTTTTTTTTSTTSSANHSSSSAPLPRSSIFLATKAGRIAADAFDYSPAWIRYSVLRSLSRLRTPYLDLVYAHDVEFVSPEEALAAVRELRRLRDEDGVVRYVGISGFPVDTLCALAERVLAETGEPLDAVLSYGHFTVQNRRLGEGFLGGGGARRSGEGKGDNNNNNNNKKGLSPLERLKKAGVGVVLNASILGMGLLTTRGIPADPVSRSDDGTDSPLTKWHPSPPGLRVACKKLADLAAAAGERLEAVAIRWSLDEWARVAAEAGVGVNGPGSRKIGAAVCGVTSVSELEETVAEWRGVLSNLEQPQGAGVGSDTYGSARRAKVLNLVQNDLWPALGSWIDYAWESPGPGFANTRSECDRGVVPNDGIVAAYEKTRKGRPSWKSLL
ncbi:hypothetical protein VTK26DRAFT_31 [Humicola hyalothermophila]